MAIVRFIPVFIILFNLIPWTVFALNETQSSSSFEVFINMDKQIFDNNESVLLHVNIKNKTGSNKTFKIYDTDYTSFRPVVYDMKGREAETLVSYRLKNKSISETIKNSSSRVINLSQNENFSHSIDIKNIYKIEPEKEYRVKAFFSPDVENQVALLSINQVNFITLKAVDTAKSGISRITSFSSPARELSPLEIVLLFLKAEKDRNWDNYFKYMDIEKYIQAYPDYVKIYHQAIKKDDIEKKEKVVIEFVNFLKKERSDYIISYLVQNELKSSENNSYVEVLIKRFAVRGPVYYNYRYLLEKFENLWLITDVQVTVAKGQKL